MASAGTVFAVFGILVVYLVASGRFPAVWAAMLGTATSSSSSSATVATPTTPPSP